MICEAEASCPPTYATADPDQLGSSCPREAEPQETWEQWVDGWVKKLDGMVAFLNPSRHESRCDEAYANVANFSAMLGIAAGTVLRNGGGGAGRGRGAGPGPVRKEPAKGNDSATPSTPTAPTPGPGPDGTKPLSADQVLQAAGFTQKERAIVADPRSVRKAAEEHGLPPYTVHRLRQRGTLALESAGLPVQKRGRGPAKPKGERRDPESEHWETLLAYRKTPENQQEQFLKTHGINKDRIAEWTEYFRLQVEGKSTNPTRRRGGGRKPALDEEQRQTVQIQFEEAMAQKEPRREAMARIAAEHGVHPGTIDKVIAPEPKGAKSQERVEPAARSTWGMSWDEIQAEQQKHKAAVEEYYSKTGFEPPEVGNPE